MYEIYSDETGHNRFRGIGSISGHRDNISELRIELSKILKTHDVTSIEWKDLTGDSKREKAAIAMLKRLIGAASQLKIRIDILLWDCFDERHSFAGVDHKKNLEFMYYKLLRWVKQQWIHSGEDWCFYPDEHTGVDWSSVIEIIENTNLHKGKTLHPDLFTLIPARRYIKIHDHAQKVSEKEPIIQAIDLLSGLHRFSKEKGELIYKEVFENKDQPSLFGTPAPVEKISRGDKSKILIFKEVYSTCSDKRMSLSFRGKRYLWSRNKEKHVNFWLYESAGEFDKAPKKGGPSV
ncbi:hypothetical protein [Leptospira licerasiae]|uniref:DUF3800 domain-containing protein n=1 Tax=Leptospira licerasiae str. MMD4847 TaxID=1049971 RepID=A0ABN0HEK5_9LEPT|nr:hypothetical protein [Leptospira licerasiae]EIE03473.1 hypothetical protein LEP1GSC185_3535 [Leptospira licerasiae serovar Varillal str. VAR 010]EJZ43980.1 hypothetical protein LEP1GSC178_2011 [Leptospira licerasiae str. MMD4847]